MTDGCSSVYYDNIDHQDKLEDVAGGIRYMPIKKESVEKPHYQPLQQHNDSDKPLQHIQRNQKRIITAIVLLGVLFLIVIVVGSTLVSISWSKLNSKTDYFQNCQQETTSCTLTRRLHFIVLPNCTTESVLIHMKDFYTLDIRCELNTDIQYLKISTLVRNGTDSIQCQCSLLDVTPNGTLVYASGFQLSFRSVSCALAITRCPV